MIFYKIRLLSLVLLSKLISKILFVEIPPVVSVGAIIERDKEILLINLSYLKGFGIPGGIIKENENIEDALKREVLEETNLKVINLEYLYSVTSMEKWIGTTTLVFQVETTGDVKDSIEGKTVWVKPEEVLNKMAYKNGKKTIEKYLNLKK